jgi:hypothetical protein
MIDWDLFHLTRPLVEVYFLAHKDCSNKYLQVLLTPQGEHWALLLDGKRNDIENKLPLEYSATISKNSS